MEKPERVSNSFRLTLRNLIFRGSLRSAHQFRLVNWIINHSRQMKEMNYAAADMTMHRYVFSEQRGLNYCLSNKPPIPDNGGLRKKMVFKREGV